jgi:hypothetical protein
MYMRGEGLRDFAEKSGWTAGCSYGPSEVETMRTDDVQRDTPAWIFQVWASFLLAVGGTAIGILYLPLDPWLRAFLGMGLVFSVGSSFSLAKTLRDNHEARRLLNRLSDAKTEKIIREYELDEPRRVASIGETTGRAA